MSESPETNGRGVADEIIEEALSHLRSGRRLPAHLFPLLFEAAKEYQLSYSGKARRADVLADTMAVPLQAVKTFGSSPDGWSNMLVLGDNLQVLRQLSEMKRAGELRNADGTDGVRLCYIDPPFATRREFQGAKGERAYLDRVEGAEFVEFLRRRLILIHELLADDGALYVHLDWKKAHYIKVVLDEIFGEGNFRNEIIWHYKFRLMGSDRIFNRKHDTILFYAKSDRTKLRPVSEEWTRDEIIRTRKQAIYADDDGREWIWMPGGKGHSKNKKKYLDEIISEGKALSDVWDLPVISSSAKERTGFPTQKPEVLLQRIVDASSAPGDLVLDCFCGSGTTLAVAARRADGPRRWIGVDSGKYAIYTTQERLLRRAVNGDGTSFTLFNAGLYDYKAVKDLPWPEYREFALRLFQCRPAEERVAGIKFDGYLGDHLVLVYNFNEHPEAKIGSSFVNDLAAVAGRRLGSRCFIIAPALAVEPYEDYLDVEGTRFFFLRIPYSIIAELHKRAFSELRQPDSKETMNAAIDSVGFDFIQPPHVECNYKRDGDDLVVTLNEFVSEAYSSTGANGDITDLAMIMADYDYDGEIFDLDAVRWADELSEAGWELRIPAAKTGDQMMLIYLDIYGNEHRETKTVKDFAAERPRRKQRVR